MNGGDDHLRRIVDRVALESLDRVERRELPRVIERFEIGKLVPRLFAEIAAVHEKEDALGAGVLQQAVAPSVSQRDSVERRMASDRLRSSEAANRQDGAKMVPDVREGLSGRATGLPGINRGMTGT